MAIYIKCPTCGKIYTLNNDQAGTIFDCPGCLASINVPFESTAAPPPASPQPWEPEPERKRKRSRSQRERDQDDDDDYRRDLQPHRGALILILGVMSLLSCALLGIPAWIFGAQDLQAMKAGRMDREGEGMTYAGYICGIIGTVILCLGLLLVCVWLVFVGAIVGAGAAGGPGGR